MKTRAPRIVLPVVVFLAWTPSAYAWSWPVQGPVLQPFSYDAANPYAAGQHRGVDIGAGATGDTVVAPAAGTVSFAGTVPTNGRSVTIQTSDGYSVTLTHLGSTLVAKGETVAEQAAVGTIGPSGTAEVAGPYVHLGIRVTSDPDGYLDPLGFLPPVPTGSGTDGSTSSQPGSSSSGSTSSTSGAAPGSGAGSGSGSNTASKPPASKAGSGNAATTRTTSRHSGTRRARAEERRSDVRQGRSSSRPDVPRADESQRTLPVAAPHRRVELPTSSSRRPVVETAARAEPTGLDAGHEPRWTTPVVVLSRSLSRTPIELLPLVLNCLAALVAVGAAFRTAHGRRRRGSDTSPAARAQVVHLPRLPRESRPASRAA